MGFCPICFETLKRPSCCIPCGHVFCTACIRRWESQTTRPRSFYFGGNYGTFTCPQCRANISHIQGIRFDDTESTEPEENDRDPWEERDDIGNIVHSLHNIWSQSEMKQTCLRVKNRLLAHSWMKKTWDCMKYCGNSTINFLSEFQQVQGGPEMQISWLKDKGKEKYQQLKSKIVNHHSIVTARTQWSNLDDDRKFGIMVVAFVLLILVLADGQNSAGLVQAVFLPVLQALVYILYHFVSCLTFCLFRPVLCAMKCLLEVGLAFVEMIFAIVRTPVEVIAILVVLPYTVMTGFFSFTTTVIVALLKTIVPLFVLVYFLSPDLQRRCRDLLAQLQRNIQNVAEEAQEPEQQ